MLETHVLTGDLRGNYFSMPAAQTGAGYALGIFERHVFSWMRTYVGAGSTAYDIGASWGYHTLFFSKLVGHDGLVCSFEPDPRDYDFLRRNIERNGIINAKSVPMAVGKSSGMAEFATFGPHGISHVAREDTASDAEFIAVQVTRLDEFVSNGDYGMPSFIKIDVEGGEIDVLEGAQRILEQMRPAVACEVRESTMTPVSELMRSMGYAPRVFHGNDALADVLFLPA